ncbi:MAG: LacI family DNA-binding transcriptional regulator [Betaproteobacteria bacterium]
MTGRRRSKGATGQATLRDVARAADVSIASASRALGKPELVSEEVLLRVLTSARELRYVPGAPRGAEAAAHPRFGAVIADFDDAVLVAGLGAMARAIELEGGTLLVAHAGATPQSAARGVHDLLARGTRAVAFFGITAPRHAAAVPGGVRFADFDVRPFGAAPSSGYLHAEAIALAALYLGQSGHRRIAMVGVRDAGTVRALCAERGGAPLALVETDLQGAAPDALANALRRWMSQEVTAVICGSDRAAGALLEIGAREGIDVPRQLSIVGYGDSDLCRAGRPSLTSLRVPAAAAGEALGRAFLGIPSTPAQDAPKFSAKLLVRESTRPPGA